MDVSGGDSMQVYYDGLRKAGGSPQTEVPGLGQGAYTYTDELTGPHTERVIDGHRRIGVGESLHLAARGAQNVPEQQQGID